MPQSFFGWVSFLIAEYYPLFLRGMANTLIISITGTILGFGIGLVVAIVRTIPVAAGDPALKKAAAGRPAACLAPMWRSFAGRR
jgi:putative lysine transport system permease protein